MNSIPTTTHRDRIVRYTLLGSAVLTALLGAFVSSTADAAEAAPTAGSARPAAEQVARGKYLMSTSGCMDCHTPWKMGEKGPEPDLSRLYSGHPEQLQMPPAPQLPEGPWLVVWGATNTAIAGPWGVSFTANLTPDMETGLGRWTERDFVQTIRSGRHKGRGREVLPPMPIMVYNHFSDRDLKAIFAYLRTIPPVRNKVPEPVAPTASAR
jgi:mono/diheme cytochrome c family protein